MSNKYDVPYLKRRALLHLATAYPTTLAAWDIGRSQTFPEVTAPEDLSAVISLAMDIRAFWIVPAAVVSLLTHPSVAPTSYSPPVLTTYLDLKSKEYSLLHLLSTPFGGMHGCSVSSQCALARVQLFITFVAYCKGGPLAHIPEESWSTLSEKTCDQCLIQAKAIFRDWRAKIWGELPEMLILPTWEEMETLKDTCLQPKPGVSTSSGRQGPGFVRNPHVL